MPIASLAKIMTRYLVLGDHPLPAGGSGPAITVTAADAAAFASDQRQGQSVVQVVRGEKLTELQALQAMLIPLRQQHRLLAGPLGGGLARGVRGQDERRGRPRSGCAARGTPTSAALTRPRRARRLAHAPGRAR